MLLTLLTALGTGYTVERLSDRAKIADLLSNYAASVDRMQWDR